MSDEGRRRKDVNPALTGTGIVVDTKQKACQTDHDENSRCAAKRLHGWNNVQP